jgi:hypothetical protein
MIINEREIDADITFDRVIKDNILSAFDTFVTSVSNNRDNYSK